MFMGKSFVMFGMFFYFLLYNDVTSRYGHRYENGFRNNEMLPICIRFLFMDGGPIIYVLPLRHLDKTKRDILNFQEKNMFSRNGTLIRRKFFKFINFKE